MGWGGALRRRRVGSGRALVAAAAVASVAAASLTAAGPPAASAGTAVPPEIQVTPLQQTVDPQRSLNLVVLGDGYTDDELDDFHADVDKHLNILWSIEPFRSYRNYINVYRVDVASTESGISCDPDDGNERRDTALSLEYAEQCPAEPNARGITFGDGGEQALEEYVSDIPGVTKQNRQTLTLANTDTYGGIGGRNATTSGGNSLGPLITPHELGHSLGELEDEYPYSDRGVRGDPYTDGEPDSAHHTTLTTRQLRERKQKWWRWLGEESLSGGRIDRFESGMYSCCDIWRPSKHSMMRHVGYPFDQVSREVMTRQISGRRDLQSLAVQAPEAREVGSEDVLWVETPHPTYHELDIRWTVNGERVQQADGRRNLELADLGVERGDTVRVTVQDPTPFVRDHQIRNSGALTAKRTWTVGEPLPDSSERPEFTGSTQTDRPVGGEDVVFVETTHPNDRMLEVRWKLDGRPVRGGSDARTLNLGERQLARGTHELTANLHDPADDSVHDTLQWTVDNTPPTVDPDLSEPLADVSLPGLPPLYLYEHGFTMGLQPKDDQDGHVVAEFRLDGDGWHNYYGWPDAPEGTPFRFTPRGTNIKEIVYGALTPGGMSWAPFEKRRPGHGSHRVEYRAIDAAGNISTPRSFRTVVVPRHGKGSTAP